MRSVLVSLFAACIILITPLAVQGQSQISYTRPSKGSAITAFDTITMNGSTNLTSTVFNWTGFNSIQVVITTSAAPNSCSHRPRVGVLGATTSAGPFNNFLTPDNNYIYTPSGTTGNTSFSYMVSNTAPFIEFSLQGVSSGGAGSCTATIIIIPQPFSTNVNVQGTNPAGTLGTTDDAPVFPVMGGGLDGSSVIHFLQMDSSGDLKVVSSGTPSGTQDVNLTKVGGSSFSLGQGSMTVSLPVTIASNQSVLPDNISQIGGASYALGNATIAAAAPVVNATTLPNLPATSPVVVSSTAVVLFTASTTVRNVTLSTTDANAVVCAAGTNAASVTTSRYSWGLKACSGASVWDGGTVTVRDLPNGATVQCIRASGDAAVAVWPF